MAEIQDTSGAKPQLRRYQSKGVQIRDTPNQSGGGEVEESTAKMWDSISQSLETVVNVGNKMRRIALEDEKVKISADMQSYYIDATRALSEGMNQQSNEQLAGFEGLYGSGKLDGSYKGLKEFKVADGYSKKAQEDMAPFIEIAEKKFHADAMKLHFGELVTRSNNQLSLLEAKSLSGLSLQLEEIESRRDSSITITPTSQTQGKRNAEGELVGGRAKKDRGSFFFTTGIGIDTQKAQAANNLLSVYVKNVLEGKVERKLMSQGAMDLRVFNYAQELGKVQFEHYAGIDEEKAFDLALKKGIVLDPGDGRDKIVFNDPQLSNYINTTRIRERSELETNKRNSHIQARKLEYKGEGADKFLETYRAFDPTAQKWDQYKEGAITSGHDDQGIAIFDILQKGVDEESNVDKSEQIARSGKSGRLYTAKEQEERMNKHSEYLFKKLGKGSGFTSAAHVKSVYQGLVLDAKNEKKAYKVHTEREDAKRTKKYLDRIGVFYKAVKGKENKTERFEIISQAFEIDPKHNIWKVKESYIRDMVLHGGIDEDDARIFMGSITPGIPTRSPKGGLDPSGMKTLQNALASYYTNELFVRKDNKQGGITSYNPDPMQVAEGANDEYNLYQLSDAQHELLANQRNEYLEIINFDNDRFLEKSTKTLTNDWRKIQDRQGSDTAKRTRAMSVIGDNYANNTLIPRLKKLAEDPNGTMLSDMKMVFDPTEGVTQDMKDALDKRWKLTGEDRSRFNGGTKMTGPGGMIEEQEWIYLDKNALQGMISPFFLDEGFLELKRQTPTAKHQISQ
jgi:hypothetical protein